MTVELSVDFLDHAAAETISEWTRRHAQSGGTVLIDEIGAAALTRAVAAPPRRLPVALLRELAPWKARQHPDSAAPSPVIDGISHYHRRRAPLLREHMRELQEGQQPHALFLTCSDSRIVPNVITGSGPGDLFTVRNVGNLVPAPGSDASLEAALAFAVEQLAVESIVVCGHSGCGAMDALLATRSAAPAGHPVRTWLAHAHGSLEQYLYGHPVAEAARAAGFGARDQLGMVNVAMQVEALRNHPLVAPAWARGELTLTGLFFDLGTARVLHVTATGIEIDSAPIDPDLSALSR